MNLDVRDVHVAYGRTEVLFGVSLEVPAGSLVCLMGRNGVGKTTLLNAVMGLLPLRAGSVHLDGRDIARLAPHQRARAGIGYVPQGHAVFPHLSVAREPARGRRSPPYGHVHGGRARRSTSSPR